LRQDAGSGDKSKRYSRHRTCHTRFEFILCLGLPTRTPAACTEPWLSGREPPNGRDNSDSRTWL
jgi:hypothetical protein